MQRKKWIHTGDILSFGGLWLLAIAATVGALVTPQEWDIAKIVAVIAIPVAFTVFVTIFFIKKWKAKPDFIAKIPGTKLDDGIAVWIGGTKITKEIMEQTIYFFIPEFSRLSGVSEDAIQSIFEFSTCQWKKNRISMLGMGWFVKDKAGIQKGRNIMVLWKPNIQETALFHEWIHMVDEYIRKAKEGIEYVPDYKHEGLWWTLESKLNSAWTSK